MCDFALHPKHPRPLTYVRSMNSIEPLPTSSAGPSPSIGKIRSTSSPSLSTAIFLDLIRKEGIRALFRGWLPAYLRLGPHALISFPIFEQIRKLFGLDYLWLKSYVTVHIPPSILSVIEEKAVLNLSVTFIFVWTIHNCKNAYNNDRS